CLSDGPIFLCAHCVLCGKSLLVSDHPMPRSPDHPILRYSGFSYQRHQRESAVSPCLSDGPVSLCVLCVLCGKSLLVSDHPMPRSPDHPICAPPPPVVSHLNPCHP